MGDKDTKETTSFSLPSRTIELMDIACELLEFDNRSKLVDRAIRGYLVMKLSRNPIFWRKFYQELREMSF